MSKTGSMRGMLTALVRIILETSYFGRIRYWIWKRQAERDSRGTRAIADTGGYGSLDYRQPLFDGSFSGKTLYLLGSGSSVNSISPEQFELIGRNDSIGINAWAVHPFVPSAYSFETGQDGDGPSEETLYVSSLVRRPAIVTKKPKFLFLRPTPPATVKNLVRPGEAANSGQFMYGRANLVTSRISNMAPDIRRIVRSAARGKTPQNVLLDNGASVVRLVFWGGLQGYQRIVLVGVDLDTRPYFWDAEDYQHGSRAISEALSRPKGKPHNSLETLDRPFPVDQVIVTLSRVLRAELGVEVMIADGSSALADRLPLCGWN